MYDFNEIQHRFEIREGVLVKYWGYDEVVIIPAEFGELIIGSYAFIDLKYVKSIICLDNIKQIERSAFVRCENLERFYITNKDIDINSLAFSECGAFTLVAPEKSKAQKFVKGTTRISFEKLYRNALFYPNTFEIEDGVLKGYTGRADLVVVPYFVHTIDRHAFGYSLYAKEMIIPDSVKAIRSYAFGTSNYSLRKLELPKSLIQLDLHALDGLKNLEYLEIPGSIKTLNAESFAWCEKLRHLKLNYGVEKFIGTGYFFWTRKCLETIEMPLSVSFIENIDCGRYNDKLCIIGQEESFAIKEAKKYSITTITIDKNGFVCDDCAFDFRGYDHIYDNYYERLGVSKYIKYSYEKVKLSSKAMCLEGSAVFEHEELKELFIPSNIKKIKTRAIVSNENLQRLILEDGVEEIEDNAICWCPKLREIYIPKSVQKIGGMDSIWSKKIIVYGSFNSEAEFFAKKYNYEFVGKEF